MAISFIAWKVRVVSLGDKSTKGGKFMKHFLLTALLSVAVLPLGFSMGSIPISDSYESEIVEHSGRTDRNGCHQDKKHGGRHCH